jgi:hypothetical protein
MGGWPAGALAGRLSVSRSEEGLRSILVDDCLEVSRVIYHLCRGIGRGRNGNRNAGVLPQCFGVKAVASDHTTIYFFGNDRVKSRAAFSSLRRSASSSYTSGAALTQPCICRPRVIIGSIPGVDSAQASLPLPSLTSIPSLRAPQRRLPLRSQAWPPNMVFSVIPRSCARSSFSNCSSTLLRTPNFSSCLIRSANFANKC